ncbi:hypothetical protein C1Y08_25840 [Pseudomonas sp. FW306-02-F02-AA]|uniref:Bacterial Ig-like domain-containing protein n=1 Tax=Pseudomonas fluorescens TaxID=294 RepID=A0A0N9W858_PSEFL|nr:MULTISPECIES: hypothetical protein [Pseudomonas]ALI00339.1 hypothetical protein AO353_04470 [Pseudomonas fluorescens]PMZ01066.1 hypothetical protein C1Y07_26920 [Pseudomonas sp. FW306-02-F02-AB]PMZ06927.1 hypothetical protein C1Y06_27080 [Pseudomonas sp. FW306-02-H06C]PMZ13008.1 hypothetical protein C1Y08_25840 [Pseudomonas sp. FW306-02-F02-AA]PMZ18287.1 hypothetical protein C1Y09_30095 [Pseudomonas sp. FW306-02-F08-AA]
MTSAVKAAPVITTVIDPKGNPISNGGTTNGNEVIVKGMSEPGKKVEVYDNNSLHLTLFADNTGRWVAQLTKLQVGAHVIKAKSDNQESAIWSFSVIAPK